MQSVAKITFLGGDQEGTRPGWEILYCIPISEVPDVCNVHSAALSHVVIEPPMVAVGFPALRSVVSFHVLSAVTICEGYNSILQHAAH